MSFADLNKRTVARVRESALLRTPARRARWLCRASALTLLVKREWFYRTYRPAPCPPEFGGTRDALKREGLAISNGYYGPARVARNQKELEPSLLVVKAGQYAGTKFHSFPDWGRYRHLEADPVKSRIPLEAERGDRRARPWQMGASERVQPAVVNQFLMSCRDSRAHDGCTSPGMPPGFTDRLRHLGSPIAYVAFEQYAQET